VAIPNLRPSVLLPAGQDGRAVQRRGEAMANRPQDAREGASTAVHHPRRDGTSPLSTEAEIDRIRRFGHERLSPDGAILFQAGEPEPVMFVLLNGRVVITQRDGSGRRIPVVEQGPEQFLAEVGQRASRPALVDGHAIRPVQTLLIPPAELRNVLVAEADLGARVVRALMPHQRPAIPGSEPCEGRGVYSWALPIEGRMCASTEVVLVGGGNSAGHGAVFRSGHAAGAAP
jgi:hypothetical protein